MVIGMVVAETALLVIGTAADEMIQAVVADTIIKEVVKKEISEKRRRIDAEIKTLVGAIPTNLLGPPEIDPKPMMATIALRI